MTDKKIPVIEPNTLRTMGRVLPMMVKQPLVTGTTRKQVLSKVSKAISWLVETVFRGFAGYIILVDKTPAWATVIVLMTGIYMTATSIGLMAYHFIKAYDE